MIHGQVLNVIHGGAAWASGQVFKGDKLVAVNGTLVTGSGLTFLVEVNRITYFITKVCCVVNVIITAA